MKTAFSPLILIALFLSPTLKAQNLVSDPGFEIMEKTPTREDNGIRCTNSWVNATLTSGDYYNTAAKSKVLGVGAPRNIFGYQQPHSGNGYAGICIKKEMVEYVETKLTTPLKKGQKYLVEFYICRAEHRTHHVNEFGVLFTTKMQWSAPKTGISIKPPVDFVNQSGYKDTKNWTKLSATYTAEGFESVMILGHFTYDKTRGVKGKAHYYIDDVSITPIAEESAPSQETNQVLMSTSPGKDSIQQKFAPVIGKSITLQNIFFNSNKSELLPGSFDELDKLSDYLIKNTDTFIEINGHTDNTGNEEENYKLSEARAKSVAAYLILKGIETARIKYSGYGGLKPVSTNDTEEGKQLNRRVEFVITKK